MTEITVMQGTVMDVPAENTPAVENATAENTDVQPTQVEPAKTENNEKADDKDAASVNPPEETVSDNKEIDLTDGEKSEIKGNPLKTPPAQKVPEIDFDLFVPRVKQLKGRRIDSLSDSEAISFALDKLTCDSYKSLKGVENTPAIACWLHLYNTVDNGDEKLARAICNSKKEFPKALKYMLDEIRKHGSGGYDHNELFDYVEKYYFSTEKTKKGRAKTSATAKATDTKKETADKKSDVTKAEKPKTKKAEKKAEKGHEQPDLFTLFGGGGGVTV